MRIWGIVNKEIEWSLKLFRILRIKEYIICLAYHRQFSNVKCWTIHTCFQLTITHYDDRDVNTFWLFFFARKVENLFLTITHFFCFLADRVAVIVFGIITLIAGVILSSVPWLNYFILKVKSQMRFVNHINIYAMLFVFHRRIYVCGMTRSVSTTGNVQAWYA